MSTLPLHKHLLAMGIGGLLAHIACQILIAIDKRRRPQVEPVVVHTSVSGSGLSPVTAEEAAAFRRIYGAERPWAN